VSGPVEWLEAELARVEAVARAAPDGPWVASGYSYGFDDWWRISQSGPRGEEVVDGSYEGGGVCSEVAAVHIALHDPDAVLRRVAADRALLADLVAERHEVVDGDCWYTCLAATEERDGGKSCREDATAEDGRCDCGRDARVERRVRLMAEGWGWEVAG
jgi:hypothetical protein